MEAPARPRAFEVHGRAGAELVDAWERHNREALIELRCRVGEGRPFRAREVTVEAGGVRLASVRGTAHGVERSAETPPADAVAVYAALQGEAVVDTAAGRRLVRPGQLLVCDVDRPLARGFGHGLHEFAVRVPKAALAPLLGSDGATALDPLLAEPVVIDAAGERADPHGVRLLRAVARALSVDANRALPADETAVLELVALLATRGDLGAPAAHRAAARAFIDDHLADPSLGAPAVAAACGVSERQLSRVFADAGTSLPRHILARRLDRAHALLRDTIEPAQRTVDVAMRCGFTSTAWFSQAFRSRFGVSAGEVRRAALASLRPD
ncbi:helix-turn-helix domain-containing protein [Nocardioides fonticola]|uniref:Helix-turn-helix domain-containing protein n=1 Tax=Nocardioides fonticola TaxID=450363 RepID=A0ABP7XHK9_9ACTN